MGILPASHTVVKNLRRKLSDDADDPTCIFTEPRVGCRIPKGGGEGKGDVIAPYEYALR